MERIPFNFALTQRVQYFLPKMFLHSAVKVDHKMLTWALVRNNWCKETIKLQWDQLHNLSIEDIYGQKEDLTTVNIVDFWTRVSKMRNALNKTVYADMAKFALLALSLPISSGVVKRVFNVMNCVKTKVRNRMGLKMLNNIIFTRSFSHVRRFCCNSFMLLSRMYLLQNNDMYKRDNSVSSNLHNDTIELFYEASMIEEPESDNINFITLYAVDDSNSDL